LCVHKDRSVPGAPPSRFTAGPSRRRCDHAGRWLKLKSLEKARFSQQIDVNLLFTRLLL